jgi:hypothetical protein
MDNEVKRRYFFKRPEEEKTLLAKREEKIKKLNGNGKSRLVEFLKPWWVGIGEVICLAILFGLSCWLLLPFLGEADQANFFSAPVIPVLAKLLTPFVSYSYGIRIWLVVFQIFLPFSLYLFVREITGRKVMGFLSALIAMLPIGIFLPTRLEMGIYASDGAHMASLTLTPLVSLLLLKFLRNGNFMACIWAATGSTIVVLTSPLGFGVLLIFMTIMVFSEMLLGQGRLKILRLLMVLILTAGFSAFWYNPGHIMLVWQSEQGQLVRKILGNLIPISLFLVPLLGTLGFLLFENRAHLQPLFLAIFLTIIFTLFSFGSELVYPAPGRFIPALGLSLSYLLATLIFGIFEIIRVSPLLDRFKFSPKIRDLMANAFLALVVCFLGLCFLFGRAAILPWDLQVLGFSTSDSMGIWQMRNQTSEMQMILGYLATILTLISVFLVKKNLIRQEK